jgi:hypothetical protein
LNDGEIGHEGLAVAYSIRLVTEYKKYRLRYLCPKLSNSLQISVSSSRVTKTLITTAAITLFASAAGDPQQQQRDNYEAKCDADRPGFRPVGTAGDPDSYYLQLAARKTLADLCICFTFTLRK